jgi:hypothetical protein
VSKVSPKCPSSASNVIEKSPNMRSSAQQPTQCEMHSTKRGSAKSTNCSSQKLMPPRSPMDKIISESDGLGRSVSIFTRTSEAWFSSNRWYPEGQGTPVSGGLGISCFKMSEVAGKQIWRAARSRSARVGDDRLSTSSKLRRWAFRCALSNSALFWWTRTGRFGVGRTLRSAYRWGGV